MHCDNAVVGCSGMSHRPVACSVGGTNVDEQGGEPRTVLLYPPKVLNPCLRVVGVSRQRCGELKSLLM